MKFYAVYDLKTGDVLQTHVEVDESGQTKELSEDEVLSMVPDNIDKGSIGVVALDKQPLMSTLFRIDPKTRKLV